MYLRSLLSAVELCDFVEFFMEGLHLLLLSTVISWSSLWKVSTYFCWALWFRGVPYGRSPLTSAEHCDFVEFFMEGLHLLLLSIVISWNSLHWNTCLY